MLLFSAHNKEPGQSRQGHTKKLCCSRSSGSCCCWCRLSIFGLGVVNKGLHVTPWAYHCCCFCCYCCCWVPGLVVVCKVIFMANQTWVELNCCWVELWLSWGCDNNNNVTPLVNLSMITFYLHWRLGLPAPFQTSADRDALFAKMDENGDGSISFDEWLAMFLKEIIAPVAAL